MKKRRIVIASVLKPVDDTRMLEKMAKTLIDSEFCEVGIIGYHSKPITGYANLQIHSVGPFARLSLSRLFAPLKILKNIRQLKPDVLIVNTHELLIVAILNRIIFGTKIIYDVRENYYRNILYTEAFPKILRLPIASLVRLKEKCTSPFFHHFFLAERGYLDELSFLPARSTVLENKSVLIGSRTKNQSRSTRLLFSGTLAESTGVHSAIALAKALHAVDPSVKLTVIGYCAKSSVLEKIKQSIAGENYIHLIGGSHLVPHTDIEAAIFSSDFGIVAYPPSRQSENSIPTKLYEYLSARLPIILQNHTPWVNLCTPYSACIPIQLASFDPHDLIARMKGPFYTSDPKEVTWESEGKKLIACITSLAQ